MPDDVKALLARAFEGEPPLGIDRDEVFAEGRARLRRRRSIASVGAAMAVVAVLGTTALAGGLMGQSADDLGPAASASSPPSRPPASTTTRPSGTRSVSGVLWPELTDAIRANQLWTTGVKTVAAGASDAFQFQGSILTVVLDSGAGYRSLTVTVEPPNTLRLFCRAGENCTRRESPDGTVVRTKIESGGGRESLLVNVRRRNGTEVSVVERPTDHNGRPSLLLPVAVVESIANYPGLGL